MKIDVLVTGTNYCQDVFDRWRKDGVPTQDLHLRRVRTNMHDAHAVAVDYGGYQMGWVARTHSKSVAQALDAGAEMTRLDILGCWPDKEPMTRLNVRLYLQVPAKSPHIVKVFGMLTQDPGAIKRLYAAVVGELFLCKSIRSRSSISLFANGNEEVAWFRKEEPGASLSPALCELADASLLVARVESKNPLTMSLHRRGDIKQPNSADNARAAISAALEEARTKTHMWVGVEDPATTHIDDSGNTVVTYPPTQKETLMNNFFSRLISINTKAAGDAAYLETGRIANNTVIRIITARLPFMARFYAKTPFGKLATANAAIVLCQQLRPNDARLQRLTAAMATMAYQETIQLIDVEGMIDQLLAEPAIKRALDRSDPAAQVRKAADVAGAD